MRRWFSVLAVLVVVFGLVVVKATQIRLLIGYGKAAEAAGPPPEVVGSAVARRESWEATLTAVGSVETEKGVTLANDAPGVVEKIRFESGDRVKAGAAIVELDASVERAQLASATARRELAATTLARTKKLVETGTLAGAQLDADQAAFDAAQADVAALKAQIEKKTVRAPFAGKLGIRAVNVGQYLPSGTAVTVLETTDAQFVDFTLPQQEVGRVGVGAAVRLTITGIPGTLDGSIAAIDPTADPVSRAVDVRATVEDPSRKLRPGMFANVSVVLPGKREVISIPQTAIVHAPYGDSVFVIEEKPGPAAGRDGELVRIARQQFVRTGPARGDFVAIEEGVTEGQLVVSAGAFKLKNGVRVEVDDSVSPEPQVAPKPQNR